MLVIVISMTLDFHCYFQNVLSDPTLDRFGARLSSIMITKSWAKIQRVPETSKNIHVSAHLWTKACRTEHAQPDQPVEPKACYQIPPEVSYFTGKAKSHVFHEIYIFFQKLTSFHSNWIVFIVNDIFCRGMAGSGLGQVPGKFWAKWVPGKFRASPQPCFESILMIDWFFKNVSKIYKCIQTYFCVFQFFTFWPSSNCNCILLECRCIFWFYTWL